MDELENELIGKAQFALLAVKNLNHEFDDNSPVTKRFLGEIESKLEMVVELLDKVDEENESGKKVSH